MYIYSIPPRVRMAVMIPPTPVAAAVAAIARRERRTKQTYSVIWIYRYI